MMTGTRSILTLFMIASLAKSDNSINKSTWVACQSGKDVTSCRLNQLESDSRNHEHQLSEILSTNKRLESELSTCKSNQLINEQKFHTIDQEIHLLKNKLKTKKEPEDDQIDHKRNKRDETVVDKASTCFTLNQFCSTFAETYPDAKRLTKSPTPSVSNTPTEITTSTNKSPNNDLTMETNQRPLMPTSCQDLQMVGHSINGFYSVSNPEAKKIETIFCDFKSVSEKRIGFVDIQSTRVHFLMQRTTSFNLADSVIKFDLEKLNIGNGMNATSGVFKAPVSGFYHFTFKGLKENTMDTANIQLRVNKVPVAFAFAEGNLFYYPPMTVALQATLKLNVGDRVDVFKLGKTGILVEKKYPDLSLTNHTQFTGSLLDEDLLAL